MTKLDHLKAIEEFAHKEMIDMFEKVRGKVLSGEEVDAKETHPSLNSWFTSLIAVAEESAKKATL